MAAKPDGELTRPKLSRSGVIRLATVALVFMVQVALFFGSAGTPSLPRGWIYYGGVFVYLAAAMAVLLVAFPESIEVVNERGTFKPDVKAWDKAFGVAYTILMLVLPAVAGLDVGRFHGYVVTDAFAVPALIVTVVAYLFVHWAMVVNKYAETGVRVQPDRHQAVISTGPYALVRHPFYAALIATYLVYPLAIGSLYAYIPALAIAAIFVWRTQREDWTLQAELPGYTDYVARVRYRLIPGVW